jgi:hypothetical protein
MQEAFGKSKDLHSLISRNATKTSNLIKSRLLYYMHENEKRVYDQRVTDIQYGTFTPLIFIPIGGMEECKKVQSRLAEILNCHKNREKSTQRQCSSTGLCSSVG